VSVEILPIATQRCRNCVKVGARVSAVAFLKNQKSSRVTEPRGAKSRMRRTDTPKPIWIKFCMVVDIPGIVTYTNFGDHRLRGFWVAGGQISPFPIDFHRRPYNTLALSCKRVIRATVCRECAKDHPGSGGCRSMCCGRGYTVESIQVRHRCDCKYYWCCYVKCSTCTKRVDVYRCR